MRWLKAFIKQNSKELITGLCRVAAAYLSHH